MLDKNNLVKYFTKGEDSVLAARGGDVRGAPRARQPHERYRGSDGTARWTRTPARGSSARGASALDPRRGRSCTLLRAECRDDVLVARLRRRRLPAGVTLWFVLILIQLRRLPRKITVVRIHLSGSRDHGAS